MGRLLLYLFALGAVPTAFAGEPEQPTDGDSRSFNGYSSAPPFTLVPRKGGLKYYPCSQCHQFMEGNPKPRKLVAPHADQLDHGKGRIWCLNCHDDMDKDYLSTPLAEKVDFDESHLVCGACHANRHRDWYFGGHGKRLVNIDGERRIYNCAHCHDPHAPALKPRKPQPPPLMRVGQERRDGQPHVPKPVWTRYAGSSGERGHGH